MASNKYQAGTQKLIQYFFPGIDFVSVLGQRDGIPVKPAPDIVYEILNKSGVEAEKALYVGDSDVDMFTAKAAGVEFSFALSRSLTRCFVSHIGEVSRSDGV